MNRSEYPFVLCPVCLRKVSTSLGFNGKELEYYENLRDLFQQLNSDDTNNTYLSQLLLFDEVIAILNGNLLKQQLRAQVTFLLKQPFHPRPAQTPPPMLPPSRVFIEEALPKEEKSPNFLMKFIMGCFSPTSANKKEASNPPLRLVTI